VNTQTDSTMTYNTAETTKLLPRGEKKSGDSLVHTVSTAVGWVAVLAVLCAVGVYANATIKGDLPFALPTVRGEQAEGQETSNTSNPFHDISKDVIEAMRNVDTTPSTTVPDVDTDGVSDTLEFSNPNTQAEEEDELKTALTDDTHYPACIVGCRGAYDLFVTSYMDIPMNCQYFATEFWMDPDYGMKALQCVQQACSNSTDGGMAKLTKAFNCQCREKCQDEFPTVGTYTETGNNF